MIVSPDRAGRAIGLNVYGIGEISAVLGACASDGCGAAGVDRCTGFNARWVHSEQATTAAATSAAANQISLLLGDLAVSTLSGVGPGRVGGRRWGRRSAEDGPLSSASR